MKQLSGLDATFLYMETSTSFGHVSSVSVYERPDTPGYEPYPAFIQLVEQKLHLLEPFRRRLVEVPLGLDHPWWINDPDFDLSFHIRHIAIPAPGTAEQLGEQVARIIGRPMDRTRPLWESYVFEGLEGGDFAVLTKVHHATIDGASGAELLTILLDDKPKGSSVEPESALDPWLPEQPPSTRDLMSRTISSLVRRPEKLVRLNLRLMREFADVTRNKGLSTVVAAARASLPSPRRQEQRDESQALPSRTAPTTPFNKSITAHRRFAFRSVPLDDIKEIKNNLGATVNDVVMAVCAGALRHYLLEHEALPTDPLVAMVPVSIRTGKETEKWTNRVSSIFSQLPTDIDDPVERVHAVHRAMVTSKESFDLMPAEAMVDFTQFSPPALATRAIRMAAAVRIADRMKSPVNLVISNVPGPRQPLYMGGAKMKHFYPVSTIVDGQGLNITVQSYLDRLDFGLVSCRELVPDLWHLTDLCVDEVELLLKLSREAADGAGTAERSSYAPAKKPSLKPTTRKPKAKAKAAKTTTPTAKQL